MHSSSGRVSRGVQKTTCETAGFWRDTGFDRLPQRAGTEHHEQTKRQADQPADNLAGSLPCSISNERSVFAMCILRFVFFCFYCSTVLLMRKAHVSHVLHCNSAYILFCPKIKKKCRKLAFSALWKHEYMISAWRTAVHDVQPSDRTARVFELFFLDIPGFSGFRLLSYPVCGP